MTPRLRAGALASALGLLPLAPLPSSAEDAGGRFAVDGVGRVTCARMLELRSGEGAEARLGRASLAAWVDGFLSAANLLTPDTYDLTPWQTTEVVEAMIASHCAANPDDAIALAAGRLTRALAGQRAAEAQETVSLRANGRAVNLYRGTLEAVREAVAARGLPTGAVGGYDEAFAASVAAVQEEAGLPPTGLPDVPTLVTLLQSAP